MNASEVQNRIEIGEQAKKLANATGMTQIIYRLGKGYFLASSIEPAPKGAERIDEVYADPFGGALLGRFP